MSFAADGSIHKRDRNIVFGPKGSADIQFIGVGIPNIDSNFPTVVPAHNAGDIIVTLDRLSNGYPTLRPGYTTLCVTGSATITQLYFRLSAIADTNNNISSIAASDVSALPPLVAIYRNAQVNPGVSNNTSETLGGSNPRNWPNLAAFVGSGSWVIGMLGSNNQTPVVLAPGDTPGMVQRIAKPAEWGGGDYAIFDSNGVLSSFTGYTWNANNAGGTTNYSAAAEFRRA